MKIYIFGYGSLIQEKSRKITTTELSKAIPVKVNGLVRGWFARTKIHSLSTTYLGLLKNDNILLKGLTIPDSVNGVIYEVSESELSKLDQREKNYIRTEISLDKITLYSNIDIDDIKVYTYLNDFKNTEEFKNSIPNKDFPIVQSYIDICMNGCIEIEEGYKKAKDDNYVREFIESTLFWSEHWANDRIFPRRAHFYEKNSNQIDKLLIRFLEDKSLFSKIYIE
jgi:cation transport regulator ChaC